MSRYRLHDAIWASLHAKLRAVSGIWKRDIERLRQFVEAVVYVLRTGVAWEDLPERFGKPNSLYRRFRRWSQQGIWDALFTAGVPEDALETVMVDATITKAQRFASGPVDADVISVGVDRPPRGRRGVPQSVARRAHHQDPRPGGWPRPTVVLPADAGPGCRLPPCPGAARGRIVRLTHRRPRLRHRRSPYLVRRAHGRGGDPLEAEPQGADPT